MSGVDGYKIQPLFRYIAFGIYCLDRTGCNARPTVNADLRIDIEHGVSFRVPMQGSVMMYAIVKSYRDRAGIAATRTYVALRQKAGFDASS